MDQYINPPEKVWKIGRLLNAMPVTYDNLSHLLKPGEKLYALSNRGDAKICALIEIPFDFEDIYENQYKKGFLLSVDFFAVLVS